MSLQTASESDRPRGGPSAVCGHYRGGGVHVVLEKHVMQDKVNQGAILKGIDFKDDNVPKGLKCESC